MDDLILGRRCTLLRPENSARLEPADIPKERLDLSRLRNRIFERMIFPSSCDSSGHFRIPSQFECSKLPRSISEPPNVPMPHRTYYQNALQYFDFNLSLSEVPNSGTKGPCTRTGRSRLL